MFGVKIPDTQIEWKKWKSGSGDEGIKDFGDLGIRSEKKNRVKFALGENWFGLGIELTKNWIR